ncbi:MAG: hypothetical protein ACLUFL_00620 [Flavonifractor plautii]
MELKLTWSFQRWEPQVQEMPSRWAISLSSESTSCITSSSRKAPFSPEAASSLSTASSRRWRAANTGPSSPT